MKEQLQSDLTAAMRAKDELTVSTLRMALTALTNEEVAGKEARQLSDADVVAVLSREVKKRREAATAYDDAGRVELAERERLEEQVLTRYLPEPLSEAELATLIDEAVAAAESAGLTGGKAMGAVMKQVQPVTLGRADGAAVAVAVKKRLGLG